MTHACPNCGGEIPPNANFCRFCGHRIAIASQKPQDQVRSSLYSTPVRTSDEGDSSTPGEMPEIDAIGSPEELRSELEQFVPILYARKRRGEIERDLKQTMEDIEAISTKLELGLADRDDSQKEIKHTKEKIAKLKDERANLADGKLPIEDLLPDVDDLQGKLQKLHEMKSAGRIEREKVYERLVAEYDAKIREIKTKIDVEKRKINVWITMLDEDLESATDEVDSLKIRRELGEVSNEALKTKKALLDEGVKMKKVAIKMLRQLTS